MLDGSSFAEAVKIRLEAADGSILTLVLIQASAIPEELLGDALLKQVRGDVGDLRASLPVVSEWCCREHDPARQTRSSGACSIR